MSVTERLDVNKNQLWRRGDATVSEKIPTRLLTGLRSFSALSVQGGFRLGKPRTNMDEETYWGKLKPDAELACSNCRFKLKGRSILVTSKCWPN